MRYFLILGGTTTLFLIASLGGAGCSASSDGSGSAVASRPAAPHAPPAASGDAASDAASSDGGSSGEGGAATFAASPCGKCVETDCAAFVSGCEGQPDCTTWLVCVGGCRLDGKKLDATCEASCTAPTSTAGKNQENALLTCATAAETGTCAASCE